VAHEALSKPASEPAVTAILPVKDYQPDYLRRSVDSVLAQTSPAWRLLIVVEDAVRAGVEAVLERALGDARIAVVVNEGRKLAGAFNTGMRLAGTEFVAILFGDDMWAPTAVAVLDEQRRRRPDVDFFHSARIIIDEHDRPLSNVYPSQPGVTLASFGPASPVKHLLCWRRDLALSFGGMDESLNSVGPDDFDFPWTMAEHGAVFEAIPDCLYLYRDHRECFRLTTHLPRTTHVREIRRIMRKHGVSRPRMVIFELGARRSYLRQCLYRSALDRWIKERVGFDARRGWRERYS
jgi:glycosyltransferase involved in cell wall biosynthesis